MKHTFMSWFFSTVVFATLTAGADAQASHFTHPFYPLKVGDRWRYRATDPQSKDTKSEVTIEVDRPEVYTRPSKDKKGIPIKDKKGNDVTESFVGYILKSTSGGKTTFDQVVVVDGEGVQRVKVAGIPITPPILFFKLPLNAGDKWTVDSENNNTKVKGTFTWRTENVSVPAGKFEAVVVSLRDGPENNTRIELDYWFVENIGMVKQRIKTKNHEIILDLERFDKAK